MKAIFDPQRRRLFGNQLLGVADKCIDFAESLVLDGFERVGVTRELHRKLCSYEEFELSKTIQLEYAREVISSTFTRAIETDTRSDGYVSSLLVKLRKERDDLGLNREWYKSAGSQIWQYEISPAKRRSGRIFLESQRFASEIEEFKAALEHSKQKEISEFFRNQSGELKKGRFESASEKYELLRDAVANGLREFGFHYSHSLSQQPNVLQFTSDTTEDAQFRFVLVVSHVSLEVRFYLTEKKLDRRFNGDLGEWYSPMSAHEVRLWDVVPWFNYKFASNAPELLVGAKAHLHCFKRAFPDIACAAKEVFEFR